jgi:hypothetical protein
MSSTFLFFILKYTASKTYFPYTTHRKKPAYNKKKVKTRAQALLRNTPCFYLFFIIFVFLAIGGSEKIAFSS